MYQDMSWAKDRVGGVPGAVGGMGVLPRGTHWEARLPTLLPSPCLRPWVLYGPALQSDHTKLWFASGSSSRLQGASPRDLPLPITESCPASQVFWIIFKIFISPCLLDMNRKGIIILISQPQGRDPVEHSPAPSLSRGRW